MKLKKKISFGAALLAFSSAYSQTDTSSSAAVPGPPIITGSFDGYYRFNFSDPPKGSTNNYTSFTNSQNSFQLGMASLRADHSFGKVSATLDLGFGRRAEEFSYANASGPTLFAIKQAIVSYSVNSNFKLTAGKWFTHIGYELADAYLNRNYSMDYMFSYGPFSHTGFRADVAVSGTTAFMVGIANPTDNVTTTSSTKYAIAQFSTGTKDGKLKAFLNYQGANWSNNTDNSSPGYKGSVNQFDLVAVDTISARFFIAYNGTVFLNKQPDSDSKNWWGSALYLNYDPTTHFGMTLRGEYFNNKDGILSIGDTPGNIYDITLSGIFRAGNLSLIPELRFDKATQPIFEKSDGSFIKNTLTGLIAVTYHF